MTACDYGVLNASVMGAPIALQRGGTVALGRSFMVVGRSGMGVFGHRRILFVSLCSSARVCPSLGNVAITVTNCKATSSLVMVTRRALAPGMLAPANFVINGTPYMVATFPADAAYVLSASAATALGVNGRPAKPGETIIAYGIGFGDVTPSILPGVMAEESNALVDPVRVSFGSTAATVANAGLAGNFVGLYEFYFNVPSTLANGDYQINVMQNGVASTQTMFLTVHD